MCFGSLLNSEWNSHCRACSNSCINSYAHANTHTHTHEVFVFCACWRGQVQPSQAKPGQARVHARSSADKTFPLVDSSTATCHGRWCDIQPLSTGQGGKQRQAQEDIRGSDGGEEGRESGENRSECQEQWRGSWCWVTAPPCGPQGTACMVLLLQSRAGKRKETWHRFSTQSTKWVLPCRENTQPPIVISPKYTHTCTVTHS